MVLFPKAAQRHSVSRTDMKVMPFELNTYSRLRPTVWHLTHRENLARIRDVGEILPASLLLTTQSDCPRRGDVIGKCGVRIRNQDLLNEASVQLDTWTFSGFIQELNGRVFFWSGNSMAPVRAGQRAREKYATDAVLRIPFVDLAKDHTPEFTRCNSGATRMQKGKPIRRGPSTFQSATTAPFRPAEVVEVTVVGRVRLPKSTEVFDAKSKEWLPLFPTAG